MAKKRKLYVLVDVNNHDTWYNMSADKAPIYDIYYRSKNDPMGKPFEVAVWIYRIEEMGDVLESQTVLTNGG
jgi:hypothetical protein